MNRNQAKRIRTTVRELATESAQAAVTAVWGDVSKEVFEDISADFRSYRLASIELRGDGAGQFKCIRISKLVNEWIRDLDGGCDEEPDWCDCGAADLERMAKRLRRHAKKLRAAR